MKQQTYPIISRSVSGRFFVDESCIYCELCVETAPDNFLYDSDEGYAYVSKQPTTNEELNQVLESLEGCPTESIGDRDHPRPNFMMQYPSPSFWQKASKWILGRHPAHTDKETEGADQPATAPESKSEGNEEPHPESEVRPQ